MMFSLKSLSRPICSNVLTYSRISSNCISSYNSSKQEGKQQFSKAWLGAGIIGAAVAGSAYTLFNPSDKDTVNDFNKAFCATRKISLSDVSKHKSVKDGGIWVTYKDKVYDVTKFVESHPGGSQKIMMAAGGQLEPFWDLYAVHQGNKEVLQILSDLEIGELDADSKKTLAKRRSDSNNAGGTDHFSYIPYRHPALQVVNQKPFNAETPVALLTDSHLTPNDIFFVRNHLPVPKLEEHDFRLEITGPGLPSPLRLSLAQLKALPHHTVEATIMCSGNRRSDMGAHKPVRGLPWQGTAISNASWTGVRLLDVLSAAGLSADDVQHIQFEGADHDPTSGERYAASLPAEVALDPRQELLLAWEMNGVPLPADHGAPLRLVAPGVVGARQVKWLSRVVLSESESQGFWQQKDYKTFSPSVAADQLDWGSAEAIVEAPVISAICSPAPGAALPNEGTVTVKGYAWSGGGRGILRVELSADGGATWQEADVFRQPGRPRNANWSWALWEAEVPVSSRSGEVELICKAVDSSQNQQPENYKGSWNVRGLMANAWHRVTITLTESSD